MIIEAPTHPILPKQTKQRISVMRTFVVFRRSAYYSTASLMIQLLARVSRPRNRHTTATKRGWHAGNKSFKIAAMCLIPLLTFLTFTVSQYRQDKSWRHSTEQSAGCTVCNTCFVLTATKEDWHRPKK